MVKKHTKPTKEKKGGIISVEKSIHLSNQSNDNLRNNKGKKEEGKKAGSSKPSFFNTKKIKKNPMKKDTKKVIKPTKKKSK